jgi:hypothetical protein
MENLTEKINENLDELKEFLECDDFIVLPYEQKNRFLHDMHKIATSGLNEEVYNYAIKVMHMIYKKRTGPHRLWLDEFELSVRLALKI